MPFVPSNPLVQWGKSIPARLDGSGEVGLMCTYAVFDHFEFGKMPYPSSWGPPGPGGRYVRPRQSGKKMQSCVSYRIATHFVPGRQKPQMWSFRLSQSHVVETLEVVSEHLRSTGVEWLWLCNKNGNPVSRCCFRSWQ